MRVIHGIWAHGASACGPRTRTCRSSRRSTRGGGSRARAASVRGQSAELADLLAALPGPAAAAARKAVDDELILQLPSAGGPGRWPHRNSIRPDGDPPGRRGPGRRVVAGPLARARPRLRPGRRAGPARAVGSLDDVAAVAGGSLPYLAALARFADGLAARGRVLPVLAAEDGGLRGPLAPGAGRRRRAARA